MRPYLAVIYDSFYEAIKSRVLWILLLGWTILLCAIAPFGWIEGTDFQFSSDSIINRDRLVNELVAASNGQGSVAQRQVWSALEPTFQTDLTRRKSDPQAQPPRMGALADGLSAALDDPSLYSPEAWPTASKHSEIADELTDGSTQRLNASQLAKVNRRLVELAFPGCLRMSNGSSIWFGYAGMKIGNAIPISRAGLQPFIEGGLLPAVLQIALGIIGIFVAIIVTSNLIPDMFAPGSMALLLSKPISRSGLLIAKFAGGIGFIVINVAYLLVGVYVLMGMRLQIWNTGILWCIPIFVFVFMIYYSVSMLAGLIWKNAIVSIVFVALFWGFCFVLGITYEQMRTWAVDLPQLTKLSVFDGQLIGSSRRGQLKIWDASDRSWRDIGNNGGDQPRRVLGPCYLADRKLMVYGRPEWNPFMGIQSDRIRLQVADLRTSSDRDSSNESTFNFDLPLWSEQRIDSLPELPSRTRRMKTIGQQVIIASELGLFELDLEAARQDQPQPSLFGVIPLPFFAKTESFHKLTPDDLVLETPIDLAAIPGSNDLALLSGNRLYRMQRVAAKPHDRYEIIADLDLALPESTLALIACNSQTCLVLSDKTLAWSIDVQTWQPRRDVARQLIDSQPQEIELAGASDSFMVLTNESKIFEASADASSARWIDNVADATAVSFDDTNQKLLVCRNANRIDSKDIEGNSWTPTAIPTWSNLQWTYWTIVKPFYTVNPKPAALSNIIRYVLSSKNPLSFGLQTDELEEAPPPLDFWPPLWSNGLFIFVMLLCSCLYLQRQDI